jgi:membrane protease YdiL (CAAX protease family)
MAWAALEPGIVFGSVLLYIWWIRPYFPRFWILPLVLVLISHAVRGETPDRLGFRTEGFRAGLIRYGHYVAGAALILLAGGVAFRTIRDLTWRWAAINFGVYCVWGVFQQYVLNGYFLNRFVRFTRRAALLAGIVFAVAHTPNWLLMLVTGAGGYLSARVYLRIRNLYFLGLAHAVLGFLIYLVIPDGVSHHLWVGPKWFQR